MSIYFNIFFRGYKLCVNLLQSVLSAFIFTFYDIVKYDEIVISKYYFSHEEHEGSQKNTEKHKGLRKIYIYKK